MNKNEFEDKKIEEGLKNLQGFRSPLGLKERILKAAEERARAPAKKILWPFIAASVFIAFFTGVGLYLIVSFAGKRFGSVLITLSSVIGHKLGLFSRAFFRIYETFLFSHLIHIILIEFAGLVIVFGLLILIKKNGTFAHHTNIRN